MSKSENRKLVAVRSIRLSPAEAAAIDAAAEARGLGPSAFAREALLCAARLPLPARAQRRDVFAAEVAPLLLALARTGNNLNQLARVANATGSLPDRQAIEHTRAVLGAVHRIVAGRTG